MIYVQTESREMEDQMKNLHFNSYEFRSFDLLSLETQSVIPTVLLYIVYFQGPSKNIEHFLRLLFHVSSAHSVIP